jgi:hypothetical protein
MGIFDDMGEGMFGVRVRRGKTKRKQKGGTAIGRIRHRGNVGKYYQRGGSGAMQIGKYFNDKVRKKYKQKGGSATATKKTFADVLMLAAGNVLEKQKNRVLNKLGVKKKK